MMSLTMEINNWPEIRCVIIRLLQHQLRWHIQWCALHSQCRNRRRQWKLHCTIVRA